jgi:Mg2+ and Co2+ transporter CorA
MTDKECEIETSKAIMEMRSRIAELEKENAELEEKISVLLSCKNCPENKGGWICVKEYENKCLAQKIEFIKELEKEKCELLGIIQGKDKVIQELKKELNSMMVSKNQQLTKAKEIIKKFLEFVNNEVEFDPEHPQEHTDLWNELCEKAEQFLNSEVEE